MKIVRTLHNNVVLYDSYYYYVLQCSFLKLLQYYIIKVWDGCSNHHKVQKRTCYFPVSDMQSLCSSIKKKKKVPRGSIQSKYRSISLLPAASNLPKEMSIMILFKSLFQTIAGEVLVLGLLLLPSTREMSRNTQAELSLPSYHLQGMSINTLVWHCVCSLLQTEGQGHTQQFVPCLCSR